jgi:hypothetical protein
MRNSKEKTAEYNKAYYLANKEKAKATTQAYYQANKEAKSESNKAYYQANKEKAREKRLANKEDKAESNKAYRLANKEKALAYGKAYYLDNKDACNTHSAKRRASKLERTVSWSDSDAIKALYTEAQRLTEETGEQHHVDHIIPLQGELVSGLHVQNNLQVLTAYANLSKSNTFKLED